MGDVTKLIKGLTTEQRALLYQRLKQKQGKREEQVKAPIVRQERPSDEVYRVPLTFSQQRMWFLERMGTEEALHNISRIFWLKGAVDVGALERSLRDLGQRHEVLRTQFALEAEEPTQVVLPTVAIELPVIDLGEMPNPKGEVQRWAEMEAKRGFDLGVAPLIRPFLFRLGDDEYAFLLTLHHIVVDGWSLDVLQRDLDLLYDAHRQGLTPNLPHLPIQYSDFALWQHEQSKGGVLEEQLGFWQKTLAGPLPVLQLPTDYPRPAVQTFRGAISLYPLSKKLTDGLRRIGKQEGVSLFMVLLAAFKVLLHRYTGEVDVVVGSPIANRTRPEVESVVGLFINSLALRSRLSSDLSFRDLLQQVRQTTLAAYARQELPFEKLVEVLAPERLASHTPVFQVLFALQNAQVKRLKEMALPVTAMEVVDKGISNFDLTLSIDMPEHEGDGLEILAQYNVDLFEAATIERMMGHYRVILKAIVADAGAKIGHISLLSGDEEGALWQMGANTLRVYPREQTVPQLFEAAAARRPEATAVIFGDETLSYKTLNEQANQLAHYLRERGVRPEVLVGLFMERSLEMVVAILAILKAGGAYVPLDTNYPEARLTQMLADSGLSLLVTQASLLGKLPVYGVEVVCVDEEILAGQAVDNLPPMATANNLVYVMYTSGSTGQPKGTSITHRSVVRLVKENGYLPFGPDLTFLHMAPASFDASTLELWGPLLNGGRLVVFPPGVPSLMEIGHMVAQYGVTTIWLTAGLFHLMVDEQLVDSHELSGLRHLLSGGDVLSVPHIRKALDVLPNCQLINGYGPTENTTFSTTYPIHLDSRFEPSIPIGQPIANTQVYILDDAYELVPIGVPGELFVGGDGLARGYLNRPGLTAERFVPNPFAGDDNKKPGYSSRLYRTGDWARWLPDGTIEFFGRRDNQVKVRGFRIELGEIETALAKHEAVQDVTVLVQGNGAGDKRLVAYVVSGEERPFDPEEIRQFLGDKLPAYMVPDIFMGLNALPLTANGKVDRRRLPVPDETAMTEQVVAYVAPRTATEQTVAEIWADVLGLEQVGIYHNFFDLGGHSLLVMQTMARIHQVMGVEMPMHLLFELPTVAGFARSIDESGPVQASTLISLSEVEEGIL